MICHDSRNGTKISWIVIHYVASPGANALSILRYYDGKKVSESAHYAVDKNNSICIVNSHFTANHCKTSGLKTYCGANNRNSIGIDLCDDKIDKSSRKVEDRDWFIPWQTLSRAASLVAFLMYKYGIDIDHVVRHYDVTHKMCPRPLVGDDINEYYKMSGNDAWEAFKADVLKERERWGTEC